MSNDNNSPPSQYKANLIGNIETDGTKKRSKNSCTTKLFK